jgi:hypothetical protein
MGQRQRRVKLACQLRKKGKQMKEPQVTVAFRLPVQMMQELDTMRDTLNRTNKDAPGFKPWKRSDLFRYLLALQMGKVTK